MVSDGAILIWSIIMVFLILASGSESGRQEEMSGVKKTKPLPIEPPKREEE